MSIAAMTMVWALDLPARDKLILLALADCANDEGIAWPSIATLARKCGCDPRTVQRNLRDLESLGLFRREEVAGKGCRYLFDPRRFATPGKMSPVTKRPETPGKLPPKPSRTINNKPKGAHELPDDWEPTDFAIGSESQRVIDGWPPGERARQLEAFRAHHGARGTKFKDWQKAWSTWVLNSGKFGNGRANQNIRTSGQSGPIDGFAKALDRRIGLA